MTGFKRSVVTSLVSLHAALAQCSTSTSNSTLLKSYDFVVIGAGAGGLTVASRLSEDSDRTVLIIEAGDFDLNEDYVTIPGLAGGAVGTKYDWNTTYVATDSVNGRSVSIPQGKVVGGSTKLNRMGFPRGSKADYDRWADLGNDGWDWASLLPFFQKSENFSIPNGPVAEEYNITYDLATHGFTGGVHSSYSPYFWPTTENLVKAIDELDIERSIDQSLNAVGAFYCPKSQDPTTATRSSAQEAYYVPASKRSNFDIITGSHVTKLVSEKVNGQVIITGVEFATGKGAAVQSVGVKREAILAAGSLHTPQILQVSGFGDSTHLSSINVTTVVDLPGVGQNLHDHVMLTVVGTINTTTVLTQLTTNATFAAEAYALYESSRLGPLTTTTGDYLAFLPLVNYTSAAEDIYAEAAAQNGTEYLPSGTPAEVAAGYKKQQAILNKKLLSTDSAVLEIIWLDGSVSLGLEHPFSRGSVKAVSSSVFDAPEADAGFLRNPLDVALLTEGVRFVRKLHATAALQAIAITEVLPGANVTSDADLETFIRDNSGTVYHPAGSAKIGSLEDGGVVDSDLLVHGTSNLRVADASVIPLLPATHTMSTVYAIGEKAAALIKLANLL